VIALLDIIIWQYSYFTLMNLRNSFELACFNKQLKIKGLAEAQSVILIKNQLY
jgi:hypothetical protein